MNKTTAKQIAIQDMKDDPAIGVLLINRAKEILQSNTTYRPQLVYMS